MALMKILRWAFFDPRPEPPPLRDRPLKTVEDVDAHLASIVSAAQQARGALAAWERDGHTDATTRALHELVSSINRNAGAANSAISGIARRAVCNEDQR